MNKLIIATLVLSSFSFAFAQGTTPQAPATQTPSQGVPSYGSTVFPITPQEPIVAPGRSAEEYLATARELAAQAAVAYPEAFLPKPLWYAAVRNAEAAFSSAPNNLEHLRYLGELYTTTQWWARAYLVWKEYEARTALDDQTREWAALSAAKIGYITLQLGLNTEAVPYLQDSLEWRDDPEIRSLLNRAQGTL